jgi:hypothetical protein
MQDIFPEVEMTTENERQDAEDDGSDSDEDIPISTILRQEKDVHERPEETEVHSNTTESTPEIFKSPVREVTVRHEISHVAKSPSPVIPFVYEGPNFIAETEQQDISDSGDSDDNVPVSTLLRQDKAQTLSSQQLQDCLEGPKGEKAIGVTVAKTFDSVEYRGTVDRFRTARSRTYYHVTYTDGDEEELTQRELRDGYILGLSKEIVAQWEKHIGSKSVTQNSDKEDNSDGSEGTEEGSDYDNREYNEEVRGKRKQRKEKAKRSIKKKKENARSSKTKKTNELSDLVLPHPGDKNVSAEAYDKLDGNQKKIVAAEVNRKTKKVSLLQLVMPYCI